MRPYGLPKGASLPSTRTRRRRKKIPVRCASRSKCISCPQFRQTRPPLCGCIHWLRWKHSRP